MSRKQTLEASRQLELAELEKLDREFRSFPGYRDAVTWRKLRIANLDWHLAQIEAYCA